MYGAQGMLVREPESQYLPVADSNGSRTANRVRPTVWVSLLAQL